MNNESGKKLIRSGITIAAEISAILSLIVAWLTYRATKNTETSIVVNTVLVICVITSILSLSILIIVIVLTIIKRVKRKSHTLWIMVNKYLESDSKYLRLKSVKEKRELVEKTRKAVKNLDEHTAFEQDVYYMILYSLFNGVTDNINVVSVLDDNEWVDTPEEDEFLRVNLAITENRIHLNRIFVVNKSEVKSKLDTKSIKSFIDADRTYIHLFVVFLDDLPRNIINDIGSGYIDFEKFVVACDVFSDNEIRGFIKTDSVEIERYYKTFMKLSEYYHPINTEFINKYLQ